MTISEHKDLSGNAVPLTAQVGGHVGVMTSKDQSLLIKPALPLEVDFYRQLNANPIFEGLLPFVPKFHGIRTQGTQSECSSKDEQTLLLCNLHTQYLVLENICHLFLKPNILDLKLGTILYDDSASPEKVERMLKRARDTTSLETGVRMTGFQIHDMITGEPFLVSKEYGYSIKAAQLPEGMTKFFPSSSTNGLPLHILLSILRGILSDVQRIRVVVAKLELRMVGSSFLIVYESDPGRAKERIARLDHDTGGMSYAVKLIDFAHTKRAPGQGPDEGVLLGMDTTIRLLEARINELRADE